MNYRDKYFDDNKSNHGWYTCAKCGKKFRKCDVDVDHIVPQKLRETDPIYNFDGLHNLQCLCKHCNRSKQDNTDGVIINLVKHNAKRAVTKLKDKVKSVFKSESKPKTKSKSTPKVSSNAKNKSNETSKVSATSKNKATAKTSKNSATPKSKTSSTAKNKSTANPKTSTKQKSK